jgi:Rab-GTPase-TBC domain
MSFIAAIILMVIDTDESLAYTVFIKLLESASDWWRMYTENTPKLFEVTSSLRKFIKKELPQMHQKLNEYNVILESLFASTMLTIFSNTIPVEDALKVIDRYILGKLF